MGSSSPVLLQRWQPSLVQHQGCPWPLVKPKIIKKWTKKFIQHQSDRYVKIKCNWWKPKGTDSRLHARFEGQILTPSNDYSSNKTTHTLPGALEVPNPNVKKPEVLSATNPLWRDCSQFFLQELQSHCGKSNPAGPQSHQSQCQAAQQRKWKDGLRACFICEYNCKTIKKKWVKDLSTHFSKEKTQEDISPHEKRLKNTNQGNMKENHHNEILLHTHHNGYFQNIRK